MDKFITWILQPSTIRGLIIGIATLVGYTIPEAKMEAILALAGIALALHEMIRNQNDTSVKE